MSNNARLAQIFAEMAALNDVLGGNSFRSASFQRVVRVLEDLPQDVSEYTLDELKKADGVGAGTAGRIEEFLKTGKIEAHEEMLSEVPEGLLALLNVPSLGPKGVHVLWKQAEVTSIAELRKAIEEGRIEKVKGFGKKKAATLLKNLDYAEKANERRRLGDAVRIADLFVHVLNDVPGVERIEPAGSLRRGQETIGDLDLLVQAKEDEKVTGPIFDAFVSHGLVDEVLAKGSTKASVRTKPGKIDAGGGGEVQVDLRVVAPEAYGAALLYFTGSKEHNVLLRGRAQDQGLTLNEYALTKKDDESVVASKSEADIYEALGLKWIPPELRQGRDELKLAEAEELPDLVELADIKAELHTHTTASDGSWSIEEIIEASIERGIHTLAITDHSKGQVQANGLTAERLEKHIVAIRKAAEKYDKQISVLAGSEVDILTDGKLDYEDELLAELDVVVASPHAALTQDPDKATTRMLKALDNPHVTILGHPTGRLILRREGLSPDMSKLCKAAAERGVAMEINANHYRLDLRDSHARLAIELGCKLSINTDAHGPGDFDQLQYGVSTARRAGATKGDIINCMTRKQLAKYLNASA